MKTVSLLLIGVLLLPSIACADIFARDNLVAWCIVPFDAKKRTPAERAEMLQRLGFKRYAYDWRAEHLPTFERELAELKKRSIELTGVWFPDSLSDDAKFILDTLAKHGVKTQLWIATSAADIDSAEKFIRPIADAAANIGCTVGLYNHGGWFGEPENQLAIIQRLKLPNVGIVYNLHHGHDHLDRLAEILSKIKPHLLCLNLNGMTRGGEKIMTIGTGVEDSMLLRAISESGYRGPIGILNHTDLDAELRLKENLDGLDRLVRELAATDYWSIEDPEARAKLPLYQTISAATIGELTPANGWPRATPEWPRSHGGDGCMRYSPLDQIDRENVKSLKVAWTYRSRDGEANVQCNPIIVDGRLYGPTAGNHVVCLDAATGDEIWRFKPDTGRPAHRGLTFHPGDSTVSPRVLFAAGTALWALDPASGKPIAGFGQGGKITITDCVAAPAAYRDVLIYAGWNRDVFGVDLASGKPLWTFNTVPRAGDEFADTWDKPAGGANCWGGMALDGSRGIAYVTTASPKPNFIGVGHRGDNLFANCVVALDALTGKRLWHFQEIRHDIWDLDIPAPPMLVTVTRGGKKVDAVAAVTKIGNTLLLDRVTGKPLFPFRLRRAPTSKLPGERTAAYQPDLELPEPFARMNFTLDDVTDISPAARDAVLGKLHNAAYGWFEPFTEGRPLAVFGIHGGAEWTGGSFDPTTGLLYVSSNHLPWIPAVHRIERATVDETKLPPTAGRKVYEKSCMACHGPNREGLLVNPSLVGLSHRSTEETVWQLIQSGRGAMPKADYLSGPEMGDLLAYLFDRDRPTAPIAAGNAPARPAYRDSGYPKLLDHENYPGCKPPWGLLNAIDLNTGKIAWRVPLGEHDELTRRGIPKTGTENFGGPTVTAGGLVFCAGTRDLKIRAFDSSTGEELWSHPLPFGGFAPPSVYEVNAKQYVVIAATGGGKLAVPPLPGKTPGTGDTYVAFSLP